MLVSAPFPPREGMGVYVWNLSRYLTRQGHSVSILTRGGARRAARQMVEGIAIWRLPFFPAYPFHVHLHGLFVRQFIQKSARGFDLIHAHSPLVPVLPASPPLVVSFHSTIRDDVRLTKLDSAYTLLMKLQAPVSFRLEAGNLKSAAVVSAISPQVAAALRGYPGCPAEVPVVWNGVDAGFFTPAPTRPAPGGYILSAGRLAPGKGLEDLLEAFALIAGRDRALRLVMAGDGPLRGRLEQRAAASGLAGRVQFLGHVPDRAQMAGLYQQAGLFALASHHEGLPTVVLEAMACGCPVVATAVGGIPNAVVDGVNGLLTPPGEPQALAEALCSALADPRRLDEMGARARRTVEQRFAWERIGARFVELYGSLGRMGGG